MTYRDWLDELMTRVDIVKIISKYMALNKKGGSFWGCCPFHHEKTPSFCVNSEKQVYHCFGCKASGNAISFIKNIESVDSAEAIRILSKEVNMPPPPTEAKKQTDDAALTAKREKLYKLMRDAARHYHDNLKLPQAEKVREYLSRRQIDERMIMRFGLGYSVDGNHLINDMLKKGYTLQQMKEAGLIAQRADKYYDVFYARLIFPIINNFGEVVAFGGRTLEANPEFAKYRNSSQTILFDKSRTIYAINLLKKRKQQAKIDYIIMTEGYMDVIALHKAGFDTAVASMGTALTQNQAKQLKNFCDKIYISYDGDFAGQKATVRGLEILAEAGLNVKVVMLPDGLDPDDVIKKHGADYYNKLLLSAYTLPGFKIFVLKKQFDMTQQEEKSQFAVQAIRVVKALQNPVEQEEYLTQIHEYTGYSLSVLLRQAELSTTSPDDVPQIEPVVATNEKKISKAMQFVLASWLNNYDYVDYSDDLYAFFVAEGELAEKIYSFCIERFKAGGGSSVSQLYSRLTEEETVLLGELLHYKFIESDPKLHYYSCITSLKTERLLKQKEKIAQEYDNTQNLKLLLEIKNIDNELRKLKDGTEEE